MDSHRSLYTENIPRAIKATQFPEPTAPGVVAQHDLEPFQDESLSISSEVILTTPYMLIRFSQATSVDFAGVGFSIDFDKLTNR